MKMKLILMSCIALSIAVTAQTKPTTKVASKPNVLKIKLTNFNIESIKEDGYTILLSQKGDLNKDSIEDLIICFKSNKEDLDVEDFANTPKRKCVIYLGNNNSTVTKVAESFTALVLPEGNGDPLSGISIKNGYFSLEHYSLYPGNDYTRIITFKYDALKKTFLIHKDNEENRDRRTQTIDKVVYVTEKTKGQSFTEYSVF
jgi:hypothetical protein